MASAPLACLVAIVAQRRERSRIARIQRRLLRRKQAGPRSVRCSDDRRSARRAVRGLVVNENWCIALLDAVVGIEDRRVNNRPEPLTRGVRRVCCNERVDQDLIPLQHLVGFLIEVLCPCDGTGDQKSYPEAKTDDDRTTFYQSIGFHILILFID